jgi:hypothetical protein
MATRANGARVLAISESFPAPEVEKDVADESMFERIMAVLAVAFALLITWKMLQERKN